MKLRYKMYSLVMDYLSPLQKGLQTAHAVVEYQTLYGKTKQYTQWANIDKGIELKNIKTYSDMMEILDMLLNNMVKHDYYVEHEFGDVVTSIVFIADERVWDTEKYPDFDDSDMDYSKWVRTLGGNSNVKLREIIFG